MSDDSEKETKSQSFTQNEPWRETKSTLTGLIGELNPHVGATALTQNENNALSGLEINARNGNEYAPDIARLARDLLGGGVDRTGMVSTNLNDYRTALQPYATGSTNPWENADFRRVVDDTTQRTMDAVKSSYQGAGIAAANYGDFGKTAGEGIARGVAPLAYQAGTDLTNRKLAANDALYGAGNTTAGLLTGMDQTALGNRQAGVGVSSAAKQAQDSPWERLLEIEAQRRGLPLENMAKIANLIVPMAQLGGTSLNNSESKSWAKPSTMETIGGIVDMGTKLFGAATGGKGTSAWGKIGK